MRFAIVYGLCRIAVAIHPMSEDAQIGFLIVFVASTFMDVAEFVTSLNKK